MNYFDLMKAITYAHVEAHGLKVAAELSAPGLGSASVIPWAESRNAGGEGEVHASVASPSFQGLTIERLISDVERIANETK